MVKGPNWFSRVAGNTEVAGARIGERDVVDSTNQPTAVAETAMQASGPSAAAGNLAGQDQDQLDIRVPERATVRKVGAKLILPEIVLGPSNADRPPSVGRIVVSAESSDQAWQRFLQETYSKAIALPPKELRKPITIAPAGDGWPQDAPLEKEASLHIRVYFQPCGDNGKPLPSEQCAEKTICLFTGPELRAARKIRVSPKHLVKIYENTDRGIGPRLTIDVTTIKAESPQSALEAGPRLQLTAVNIDNIAAEWRCVDLTASIDATLRGIHGKLVEERSRRSASVSCVPRLELSPDDRKCILEHARQRSQPLRITIRIEASSALPVEVLFEIHPQQGIRDGLIVFDLGTSASTILRHNPAVFDESEFPAEQFRALRVQVLDLLHNPGKALIDGVEQPWIEFLAMVCNGCDVAPGGDPGQALIRHLGLGVGASSQRERFYRVLRQLELQAKNLTTSRDQERMKVGRLRNKLAQRMYRIYEHAFEQIPLGQWNIELLGEQNGEYQPTLSELELTRLEPLPEGVLGSESMKRRLDWLAQEVVKPLAGADLDCGRFFDCPKQFLPDIHDDRDRTEPPDAIPPVTTLSGGRASVTAGQILQGAWTSLIDDARGLDPKGIAPFDHVVATYPADLRPEARGRMEQALREIGMVGVYLDFDESIAPAIFHLEQLFGDFVEIGCEAFKVECVREGRNLWAHHMLVLDIGAGTTDASLVRLEMREFPPDRTGYGGRLYEIAPRLLGVTGRSNAGGHQLTLKLFHALKQVVAHWIQDARANADATELADDEIHKPLLSARSDGTIVFHGTESDSALKKALGEADAIIPTRFESLLQSTDSVGTRESDDDGRRNLKRFTALWQWSEELKIGLADQLQRSGSDLDPGHEISIDNEGAIAWSDYLRRILDGTSHTGLLGRMQNLPRIKLGRFIEMAQTSVEPSVDLALGMAQSALANFEKFRGSQPNASETLGIQSIVLSGRAATLPQVIERLERWADRIGSRSRRPRIRFRREYAKSATAIGACRGQRRIVNAKGPSGLAPESLEGRCEMDLRVQNLFYYLAASFRFGTATDQLGDYVFDQHSEFWQTGRTPNGIIRSDGGADEAASSQADRFVQPQRETSIYRDDGMGSGQLWSRIVVEDLARNVAEAGKLNSPESISDWGLWRIRFEISHQYRLSALLLRPDREHKLKPIFDIGRESDDPATIRRLDDHWHNQLTEQQEPGLSIYLIHNDQPLIGPSNWEKIRCIGVSTDPSNTIVDAWMSGVLGPKDLRLNLEGIITIRLKDASTGSWLPEHSFAPMPKDPETGRPLSSFPFATYYRIVVTRDGRIALVLGKEPSYWETEDVLTWLTSEPGRILRKALPAQPRPRDWWKEPFCGKH